MPSVLQYDKFKECTNISPDDISSWKRIMIDSKICIVVTLKSGTQLLFRYESDTEWWVVTAKAYNRYLKSKKVLRNEDKNIHRPKN